MTRLAIVKPAVEEPIDLYTGIRARVNAINWEAVHIRGDRAPAVSLPDRIRGVVRL